MGKVVMQGNATPLSIYVTSPLPGTPSLHIALSLADPFLPSDDLVGKMEAHNLPPWLATIIAKDKAGLFGAQLQNITTSLHGASTGLTNYHHDDCDSCSYFVDKLLHRKGYDPVATQAFFTGGKNLAETCAGSCKTIYLPNARIYRYDILVQRSIAKLGLLYRNELRVLNPAHSLTDNPLSAEEAAALPPVVRPDHLFGLPLVPKPVPPPAEPAPQPPQPPQAPQAPAPVVGPAVLADPAVTSVTVACNCDPATLAASGGQLQIVLSRAYVAVLAKTLGLL